jgi:two-component system chemotaxis sensor kinase CheA
MNEKEVIDLIFAPGMSTAEVTTDISGRGVGMDVVKSKISHLGGNVSVYSVIGQGTTITISLPSTMSIVQALLIKVGHEVYAAPLNYISEVINIHPNTIRNVQNNDIIVLRGKTLPLVKLSKLLEVPGFKEDPDEPLTVVIVKSQGQSFGFVVSELVGQQEIVIKPINKKLCSQDYISGATTLGNGIVALILNVNELLNSKAK